MAAATLTDGQLLDRSELTARQHAARPGSAGQGAAKLRPHGRVGMRIGFAQHQKSLGLQRIAGQYGGGFIKGAMHGGLAAAQIIIIHAGQIIMHQRIGVQHFNRRRHAQSRITRHAELRRAFQHQESAQSFAAADAGVTHGFKKPRLITFRRRDQRIKRLINFRRRRRHG
jgi:hypothetical protein